MNKYEKRIAGQIYYDTEIKRDFVDDLLHEGIINERLYDIYMAFIMKQKEAVLKNEF